jgi:hypothetical protein
VKGFCLLLFIKFRLEIAALSEVDDLWVACVTISEWDIGKLRAAD